MIYILKKILILFSMSMPFFMPNSIYAQKETLFENEEIVVKFNYEDSITSFYNKKEKYMLWGENYQFYNYGYQPFRVELINKNHSDSTLLFMLSAGVSSYGIDCVGGFFILLNKNIKQLNYIPLSDHRVLNNPKQRDNLDMQFFDFSRYPHEDKVKKDIYYFFEQGEFYLEIKWYSFLKTPERVVYKKYKQLQDKMGLLYFVLIEHTDTKPD